MTSLAATGSRGGPPTLEAVAALAGVSRATVSRVVNDSPKVSPEARDAVERAIAKLGYVPNRAARSLVTRRSDTIALVLQEDDERLFSDPFFAGVVRGVSQALSTTELQLVLVMMRQEDRGRVRRYLLNGHVDGVLLTSVHGTPAMPGELDRHGIPVVLAGGPLDANGIPYVDADNRSGARDAVRHLLGTGRRTVATITGPDDMRAGRDRLAGYRDALREARVRWDRRLVAAGDFTQDGGARAMELLLAREPSIDGVFAASDLMAAGALRTLRAAGRRVPDDVALVGFDDSVIATYTDPHLTTVRQPVTRLGTEATRLLLALLGGSPVPEPVVLPTELVVRDST